MPDRPEMTDLFTEFADEVSARPGPPAAAAVRRARQRRARTTSALSALAVVLVLVAGAAVAHLTASAQSGVAGQGDDLPAAHVFDTATLASATSGWMSGWQVPDAQHQPPDLGNLDATTMAKCMNGKEPTTPDPVKVGNVDLFTSSAYFSGNFIREGNPTAAGTLYDFGVTEAAGCMQPGVVQEYADGTRLQSFTSADSTLWVAQHDTDVTLAWLMGSPSAPSTDIQAAIGRALVAGMHSDASYQANDSLGGSVSVTSSASAVASSGTVGPPDGSSGLPAIDDQAVEQALAGFGAPGTSHQALPCVDPSDVGGATGSGFDQVAGGSVAMTDYEVTYSQTTGGGTLAAYEQQLRSCSAIAWQVRDVKSPSGLAGVVATSSAGTVWAVERGDLLLALATPRSGDPTRQLTDSITAALSNAKYPN